MHAHVPMCRRSRGAGACSCAHLQALEDARTAQEDKQAALEAAEALRREQEARLQVCSCCCVPVMQRA